MTDNETIVAGMAELGIELDPPAIAQLNAYLVLLDKCNHTHNLTAIRDPRQMVTHHLLDSLAVLPRLRSDRPLRILDIGSGGGLPGIPIAIAQPAWHVALLDSNHKKTAFLRQAVIELKLANVEVATARAEAYANDQAFDIVISRAFSDLATFVAVGRHALAPGGRLVAMKGVYPHEEIGQLPDDIRVSDVSPLKVPGLDGTRHMVMMESAAA
jgi:16S rRNA (guanine527-N7)-methyltransferase